MSVSSNASSRPSTKTWFLRGLRDGIPIAAGYLAVSFTLGIEADRIGMNALQGFFMSLGMHASAGEYAALLLIAACAGAVEMITTTVVINLRYFLMGCSLSQKLKPGTKLVHRFLLPLCMTDEVFGISSAVEGYLCPFYTYGAMIVAACGWEGGTVLGILVGSVLPAKAASAMGVALYGMFLAIIIPPGRKEKFMAGLVLISMAASWIFSVIPGLNAISDGFRVIILTILIAGIAAVIRPVKQEADHDE